MKQMLIEANVEADTAIEWSDQRLLLPECTSDFYTFIYDFNLCGLNLLDGYGDIPAKFSLNEQCLVVPPFIFNQVSFQLIS